MTLPDSVWNQIDAEIQLLLRGRSQEQLIQIADASRRLGALLTDPPYPPTDMYSLLLFIDAVTNRAVDLIENKK